MVLTLYLISLFTFLSYISYIWIKYGVLSSISESYYVLPGNLKIFFTFFCWGVGFPLMIIATPLSPLFFLATAAIMFVGAAAQFKRSLTNEVHYIAAGLSAVFSQLALGLHNLWYIPIIFLVSCLTVIFVVDKNDTWWVEILAFMSTYIGVPILLF